MMPMTSSDRKRRRDRNISHTSGTGDGDDDSDHPKTPQLGQVIEAIETVSYGLLMLNTCKDDLDKLGGKALVDAAARLNKQVNDLYAITTPLKDRVKNECLTSFQGSNQKVLIQPGSVYQAKVCRISKTRIMAEKVKAILGKNLYKVQEKTDEIQVSFEVRG